MVLRMIIYLDLIVLVTICSNIIMIETVELLFHSKIHWARAVVSSLFLCASLSFYFLPIPYYIYIRYFIGLAVGIYVFYGSFKTKIKKIALYYLMNLAMIGTLEVFKIKDLSFLIMTLFVIILLGILSKTIIPLEVLVTIKNKKHLLLYDSGNSTYYKYLPVVYLKESLKNSDYIYNGTLQYQTVEKEATIDVYYGPPLYIGKNKYIVAYAFSNIDEYDGILHQEVGI